MQIGVLVETEPDAGVGTAVSSGATIERLAALETEGFDAIWLGCRAAASEGALLELAALAAATTRARLGVFGPPPAALHPLRLAEDLAMIDIVSAGRLDWIPTPESAADDAGDLDEVLEIVVKAWHGERFAHRGPRFAFPEIACFPRPEQTPHPTIWLRAGVAAPTGAAASALGTWCEGPVGAAARGPARPLAVVGRRGERATLDAPTASEPSGPVPPGRPKDRDPAWWIVRLDRDALAPEAASLRRRLVAAVR